MDLQVEQIAHACGGQLITGSGTVTGVEIDSRKVRPGDLFVPIKGENVDGHDFLSAAAAAGATAVLWGRPVLPDATSIAVIQVDSPEMALQELATWYRSTVKAKVVAVTGSVGKTSTKDFIAAVLRTKYKVLANKGNYNTEIGLPLTLFELTPDTDYAVLEMGMRGPGQVARLAEIAKPLIGVITNIGESHIELLGSQEAIALAKGELMEAITLEGWGILNGDDPLAVAQSTRCRGHVALYGLDPAASDRYLAWATDLHQLADGRMRFQLRVGQEQADVTLAAPGRHNVHNSLAAAAVGKSLGLNIGEISQGLHNVQLTAMRCEIMRASQGFTVINDTYNACVDSMRAGLELLASLTKNGSRSIAVLGDMLELGHNTRSAHQRVGAVAAELGISLLITVGKRAQEIAVGAIGAGMSPAQVVSLGSTEEASDAMISIPRENDVVLVKGSRGMRMEKIVMALTRDLNYGQ